MPSFFTNTELHSSMPQDGIAYDGYDEFIKNLQEDLENDDSLDNDKEDSSIADGDEDDKDLPVSSSPNKNLQRSKRKRKPKYQRDPTDDMSRSVDEKEVMRLIVQRSKAQQDKNYVRADDILDELNNVHEVYVWDREGLWSCSSIAPGRRYKADRNNARGGGKQFGRNGHDYQQIGDGIDTNVCTLPLHEIHSLIAKRLEYKLVKKFDKADEVQSLLYDNGVKVHDKLLQWRADSGIFADIDGMVAGAGKPFEINEFSETLQTAKLLPKIEELVAIRDQARYSFNYGEADSLRVVLWENYRVAVDDRSRTYSIGGDFGPYGTFRWTDGGPINPRKGRDMESARDWRVVGGMYIQSPLSKIVNEEDKEEINNLIHDRLEAKRVQDFEVADLIRDHLYQEYEISVDDRMRQWSVGGDFDQKDRQSVREKSPTSPDGKLSSYYVRKHNRRGGTGHLSKEEISLVEAMIQRRSEEMSRFNKQAAMSIRNGLKKRFYVVIDDINGEWHIRGNDYILSPSWEGRDLPKDIEESREEIEKLIRERAQAKYEKDYNRADEIRSDLKDTYSIKLDDRLKEWNIDAEPGTVDESKSSLSKMSVLQMKDRLHELGLPVSGKKADLLNRLSKQLKLEN